MDPGDHALSGENLFADAYSRNIAPGQIKVNSRAEPNHAVTLAARQGIAGLRAADDAPGHQARDLDHTPDLAVVAAQAVGATLIFHGGLVKGGVEKFAGPVADILHHAVHGRAVDVHAEDIHKNADAAAGFVTERIGPVFDTDDSAVRRADGQAFALGHDPLRVAEKMQAEPAERQQRQRRKPPVQKRENQSRKPGQADAGPSFGRYAAMCWAHGNSKGNAALSRAAV